MYMTKSIETGTFLCATLCEARICIVQTICTIQQTAHGKQKSVEDSRICLLLSQLRRSTVQCIVPTFLLMMGAPKQRIISLTKPPHPQEKAKKKLF